MWNYLKTLLSVIGWQYRSLVCIFVLFIVLSITEAIGIGIIIPIFSSLSIEGNNIGGTDNQLFSFFVGLSEVIGIKGTGGLLLIMAAIFLLKAIIGYTTTRVIFSFGYSNQKRLIDELVKKYQKMSVSEYTKIESSELIQNLIINVETVMTASVVAFVRLISETFVFVAICVILLFIQPIETIVLIAVLISVILAYSLIFKGRIKKAGEEAAKSRVVVIKNFQSIMQGFKEVKIIARLDYFNNMIFNGTERLKKSGVEYKSLSVLPRYCIETTTIFILVSIFFLAEAYGKSNIEIMAMLAMFAVAGIRLVPGLNQITSSIVQMNNSSYALSKVYEGLNLEISNFDLNRTPVRKTRKLQKSTALNLKREKLKKISVNNVQFTYEGNQNSTFSDLSLYINEGELVCFHGESGSGKSTTFDLMLNFLPPDFGRITTNGIDIHKIENWISSFAFVPQDPFLFSGTIRENIAVGLIEVESKVSIDDAVNLACLKEFLEGLPEGLETTLGERGVNISGGQRQRIALARSFFLDRSILLLDEPTSALDEKTAKQLMQNILGLRGQKTIIISSHNSDVVNMCDRTYYFKDGKVII